MVRRIELRLQVDGRGEVPLTGAGAAGYEWSIAVEGRADVVRPVLAAAGTASPAGQGGSVPQSLVVTALKPGRTLLRLRLARPWELPSGVREEVEVAVEVLP